MKSNKILIVILVVLVGVATFFMMTDNSNTIDNGEGDLEGSKSDFSIQDTTQITKIFIADRKGKSVTLTKAKDAWKVDGKYNARPDNVRLLMKTFNRVKVKSPVPKAALENVKKQIITEGVKVEIYTGGDAPEKTWYVGGPTLDNEGTYMYLETDGLISTRPFIMHIQGFYGYLTTRFFTESSQWRDPVVFKYMANDIKNISVQYHEKPGESFLIENDNNNFVFRDMVSRAELKVDTNKLNAYVSLFEKIYYEMVDIESTQVKIDSIIASPPYFTIEVNDFLGNSSKIVSYHMPNFRQVLDKDEQPYLYDVDRMYAHLNDDLFIFIQFATFDQITPPKSFFLNKE